MSGLTDPTSSAFLPDGRVIVTQKDGRLFLVVEVGVSLTSPRLTLPPSEENERGVSGVTVDPNLGERVHLRLLHDLSAGVPASARRAIRRRAPPRRISCIPAPKNRVSRFTLAGGAVDPDSRNRDPRRHPLRRRLSQRRLHGLWTRRLPAKHDGRRRLDRCARADLDSLSGKVLRIAADGSVPADNPYVSARRTRRSLRAPGFRNPWMPATSSAVFWSETSDEEDRTCHAPFGWPWFGPSPHRQRARGARRRRRCRAARVEQPARAPQLEATPSPVPRRRDPFLPPAYTYRARRSQRGDHPRRRARLAEQLPGHVPAAAVLRGPDPAARVVDQPRRRRHAGRAAVRRRRRPDDATQGRP